MFDKLIESDTTGADFKPRRRYFIVASAIVGLLFGSAVVISLYAADIDLGHDNYELSAIVAPVQPPAEKPEQPRPRPERAAVSNNSESLPIRIVRQQDIDKTPVSIPPISTEPNRYKSLTEGMVKIGKIESDPERDIGSQSRGWTDTTGTGSSTSTEIVDERPPKVDLPPPAPARPRSLGVVNGIAIRLPNPAYPSVALAVNSQGKVDVQIMIDEHGSVVSAKAVDGPALLRQVSEQAAMRAKFKPTFLSNVPVKVTGVIVYNFTRN